MVDGGGTLEATVSGVQIDNGGTQAITIINNNFITDVPGTVYFSANSGNILTLNGVAISGPGSVQFSTGTATNSGSGVINLNAASTYTGGTTTINTFFAFPSRPITPAS